MKSTDWKLGLFALLGLVAAFGVVVFLGVTKSEESVFFVTYFDESVQGLEIGAPVKLRGVPIGHVAKLGFAPDRQLVEVVMSISVDRLESLGLPPQREGAPGAPADVGHGPSREALRTQLASSGITGFKYVAVDIYPEEPPPAPLSFTPPESYVPSLPSLFADLESGVRDTLSQTPLIAERLVQLLDRLLTVLDETDVAGLTAQGKTTLRAAEDTLLDVREVVRDLGDAGALVADARGAVADIGSAARATDRAADSLDEVLRGAPPLLARSETTLEDLGAAARALRLFADALERDPDMLLHGRGRPK